ncbi:MAG: glycosyltransferase [Xenococcus sp. MO_188.B8]|nr:glycosyltransferase [Xenococcus sp. MO_188.B8]
MIENNSLVSSEPLLSVIVPYYKHQIFIERCLDSIANQTYQKIEVIVIDDCSPDGSGSFVEQLVKQDKYRQRFGNLITFESFKKNCGAHVAINYGINKARGDLISIINSDDKYHSYRFKIMIAEMQKHRSEIAFSKVRSIDENDNDVTESHPTALNFREIQNKVSNYPTVGFACVASNIAISTGNFVFTKTLYNKVGEFLSYRYCHDWDFLLRALLIVEPLFVEEDLYFYRFHGKNTFESVQNLAVEESRMILQNYFSKVKSKPTLNDIAPSPFNWSRYFELFLQLINYQSMYNLST